MTETTSIASNAYRSCRRFGHEVFLRSKFNSTERTALLDSKCNNTMSKTVCSALMETSAQRLWRLSPHTCFCGSSCGMEALRDRRYADRVQWDFRRCLHGAICGSRLGCRCCPHVAAFETCWRSRCCCHGAACGGYAGLEGTWAGWSSAAASSHRCLQIRQGLHIALGCHMANLGCRKANIDTECMSAVDSRHGGHMLILQIRVRSKLNA